MSPDEMPEGIAQSLIATARESMPFEACGFLYRLWPEDDWTIEMANNVSKTPQRSFKFDDDVLREAFIDRREDLIGIFHSHPSGRSDPSAADVEVMLLYPGIRHWVVTCMNVWEWIGDDEGFRPARRNGTPGIPGMAYPVLTSTEAVRRKG